VESSVDGPRPRRRLARRALWLLSAAITAGVLFLSLGPDVVKDRVPDPFKPLPHIVAYIVLSVVVFWVRGSDDRGRPLAYWVSVLALGVAMIGLGAALEGGQALVHRDTQLADVEADAIGVLFGLGVWLLLGGIREVAARRHLHGPRSRTAGSGR
jgi:VanZ family protein